MPGWISASLPGSYQDPQIPPGGLNTELQGAAGVAQNKNKKEKKTFKIVDKKTYFHKSISMLTLLFQKNWKNICHYFIISDRSK